MKHRLFFVSAAVLALAGCDKAAQPANDTVANITTLDANSLPPDANITDVPADDGDAPTEAETNAK
ncbi:hypothetical protein [Sphingomonas bacterium]|uniref:hypothetical protein n=1 Tax=Sphingomonas bacterium TaxID=1895847 RepID=UPI002628A94C|nr:hypothetical protein [Sphingomonas bacterium]MDB5679721.1 hypothetical protein [Sphingomonas bacterium]